MTAILAVAVTVPVLASCSACRTDGAAAGDPHAGSANENGRNGSALATATPGASAPVPAPARPAPTPADLGYAGAPPSLSRAAYDKNREGLRAHDAQHYEESERLFSEALTTDPTYTMARFNLACTLARQGSTARAREEALRAAEEDPAEMVQRAREDADLEVLRSDASFARELTAIDEALQDAMVDGIPVFVPAVQASRGPAYNARFRTLRSARAAVLVKATGRVIPITAVLDGATTGIIDMAARRVLLVAAGNDTCGEYCYVPDVNGAALFDLSHPAAPIAVAPRPVLSQIDEWGLLGSLWGVELALAADSIFLRATTNEWRGSRSRRVVLKSVRITTTAVDVPESDWPQDAVPLRVGSHSAWLDKPSDFTVVRGTLRGPGRAPWPLPRDHRDGRDGAFHHVVVNEATQSAIVATERTRGAPNECSDRWSYAIDSVDLRSGETVRVAAARGNPRYFGDSRPEQVLEIRAYRAEVLVQVGYDLFTWTSTGGLQVLGRGLTLTPPYDYSTDTGC